MPGIAEAQRRHAAHYLHVVREADRLFKQGGSALHSALELFEVERTNVLAGMAWAERHMDKDEDAAMICSTFPNAGALLFELLFSPRERLRWLESALKAARGLDDREAEAWHVGNIGLVHLNLCDIRKAIACFKATLTRSGLINSTSAES
jgi:hypothetical protein